MSPGCISLITAKRELFILQVIHSTTLGLQIFKLSKEDVVELTKIDGSCIDECLL